MNTKTLTIGGILLTALGAWVSRITGLVSDAQLLYAFFALSVVTLSASISYIISWTATDGYKKYNWPPNRWKEQAIKRKIFKCAWWSGGGSMVSCGTVVLICAATGKLLLVYSIIWLILSVMVGATSPGLRDFFVDNLIQRLKRWAKGRNEIGNEALDRPSEVPRD